VGDFSVGISGVVAGKFKGIGFSSGTALLAGATCDAGGAVKDEVVNQPPLNTTVKPKNVAVKNQVIRFKAVSALFVLENS
jgi:uncharacterized membrane protein YeiH